MSPKIFIPVAVLVCLLGAAAGYFLIGSPRQAPKPAPAQVAQNPAQEPVAAPPAAPAQPAAPSPKLRGTDYTAPGAPRVEISEDKSPALVGASRTAKPVTDDKSLNPGVDSEQSQTGDPQPSSDPLPTHDDADPATANNSENQTDPPTNPTASDPDFEKVGSTGQTTPGSDTSAPKGKPLFRVQTGSFLASSNAQGLADALKLRGYKTSVRTEQAGDKTVYKVQTGAYRTRDGANKAALILQKTGYPAYVSPISP